ncbi:hypothetical protein TRFO_16876 [Tritrichomonas foetus]|uniref:DUF3447 domain-containing protein n=1 Tax=Tritrichomonas foetus TaxID=1144522 RepID=A0A1J4KUE5_9EUKA|nr:hypothetical protein TRFO_16876 [Tritrichomonas foetus]|eukprot:OHT13117.1 hypothetical protein TRFO_16876 [Tritrichomonas foetus]
MSIQGYDEFIQRIKTLSNLENNVHNLINCAESEQEEILQCFNVYLKEIEISKNFILYNSFIQLLGVMSSIKFIDSHAILQMQRILDIFLSEHNLKDIIPPLNLWHYFKINQWITSYLYEKGLIEAPFLIAKADPFGFSDDLELEYISYLYDIYEHDLNINEKVLCENCLTENDILQIMSEEYLNSRKKMIPSEQLIQMIQKDDVDAFIDFISNNNVPLDYKFINMSIKPMIIPDRPFLNYTLFNLSLMYGALKIFKYLWLNKTQYNEESMEWAIIGGNNEIIQILDEESDFSFNEISLECAVKCHNYDMFDYIINTKGIQIPNDALLQLCFDKCSYSLINQFISQPENESLFQTFIRNLSIDLMEFRLANYYLISFVVQKLNAVENTSAISCKVHLNPIFKAVDSFRSDIVELLVKNPTNNVNGTQCENPLVLAVTYN